MMRSILTATDRRVADFIFTLTTTVRAVVNVQIKLFTLCLRQASFVAIPRTINF